MKTRSKLGVVAAMATAVVVSGCSGGGGKMMVDVPIPAPPQRLEDQFGTGFGTSFRQDRTTAEPTDPMAADIEALSLVNEPRDVP